MKRSLSLLLIAATLLSGTGVVAPEALYSAPVAASGKKSVIKQKRAHKRITKKKHRRHGRKSKIRRTSARAQRAIKQKAITVLREYLPEYADILATKTSRFQYGAPAIPATFDMRSPFALSRNRTDLLRAINSWVGTRYRFGGCSPRGIDCSGFTSTVISKTLNMPFYGNSRWQAGQFEPIFSVDSLQLGDLIFFSGRNRSAERIGHVGIYLGNGVFAHSSTGRGVIYTHISQGYYKDRFRWGGRILVSGVASAQHPGGYSAR